MKPPADLRMGLAHYFRFYNTERHKLALNRQTPDSVYMADSEVKKGAS